MTIERALSGIVKASAAVYVEDVFSTYLYNGTSASQTITNGIDLSTKGGLVWIKSRTGSGYPNALFDTARGANYILKSDSTAASSIYSASTGLTGFTTSGFTLGTDGGGYVNESSASGVYASWTFRKQAKFCDIVTYTGNGVNEREIAHNLGCEPGFIIIKRTDTSANWKVRETQNIGSVLCLNTTDADGTTTYTGGYPALGSTPSTVFKVRDHLNPSDLSCVNANGGTYVAYLFAKSNSGGFGAAGTDSVVAAGYFTTASNGLASVNLGWEPQYVLIKSSSRAGTNWIITDNMRGMTRDTNSSVLYAENTNAEYTTATTAVPRPSSTGFDFNWVNGALGVDTFIYLAIRRGPMKTPTDATKVFSPITSSASAGTAQTTGFPVDMQINAYRSIASNNSLIQDRLRGVSTTSTYSAINLQTSSTAAEDTTLGASRFWDNNGFQIPNYYGGSSSIFLSFRRAPGFFDVVCYTGTGSATTVAHNLGVAPELMIVKNRSATSLWAVYSSALGANKQLRLEQIDAPTTNTAVWNNTAPTSSVFSIWSSAAVNSSGANHLAYLFATCPGVSKVGSYTGNGSSQTINCGFASGARFVLIKRTDSTGDWYVWDTARGIVSANDPHLSLNTTAAEVTTDDTIDPDSSGFIVNQVSGIDCNVSSATYIYLAIA